MCTYLIFFLLFTRAWSGNSNDTLESFESNELETALEHLASLEGQFKIGSCFVEIKYCKKCRTYDQANSRLAGDVYILDADGDERYVPIYSLKSKIEKSHGLLKSTENSFIYRFKDKNYDDRSGNYEWYDLEIVKKSNLVDIDYIEVGHSSQTERKNRTTKKWIVCGEEREEFVKKHPIKYRIRSWWWWLTHI